MRRHAVAGLLVIAGCMSLVEHAFAQSQPWLEDRRFGEGIGVRLGDFELHPGVAGEIGFDSNFYQGSGRETPAGVVVAIPAPFQPTASGSAFGGLGYFNEPKTGAYRYRLTPSVVIESLGRQRMDDSPSERMLDLRATLSASYNELQATRARFADSLSHRRFVTADAGIEANLAPGRPWGVRLDGNYSRAVQPANDPQAPPGFDRSTFRAGSAVEWRPGGDLLRWSLGYQLTYVSFEDALFSNLSNLEQGVVLDGRWRFLPRTSLLYRGSYSYLAYAEGNRAKPAGAPLVSQVGLNGLMTDHFGLLATIGWKSLFFATQAEFNGLVGELQLAWYPTPQPDVPKDSSAVGLSSIKFGYRRDATAAYLGNFVQTDSLQVKGSYFLGGAVMIRLEAGLQRMARPEAFFSTAVRQTAAFNENRANALGFVEYRASDRFGVNATLRYSAALSERYVPLSSDASEDQIGYDEISFNRLESWLGVRWFL